MRSLKDSIEHDAKWAEILRGMLYHEKLANIVSIMHAPLTPYTRGVGSIDWYDIDLLEAELKGGSSHMEGRILL